MEYRIVEHLDGLVECFLVYNVISDERARGVSGQRKANTMGTTNTRHGDVELTMRETGGLEKHTNKVHGLAYTHKGMGGNAR